jgi:ABC-2 type transport system ATP-binding protein
MRYAVSIQNVEKSLGGHRAVAGLSLNVPEARIFGLLGRNGAGKTTIMRLLMDIIRPDSGRIVVLGEPAGNGQKELIGYLPEERGLYPDMKVLDLLEFLACIKGLHRVDSRVQAAMWLERLDLGSRSKDRVDSLSKGMQQKVQFIAAVLGRPELLILDEPFSGMDPVNQDLFKEILLELNHKGVSVIFSTHIMDWAERLCHEVAMIDNGRLVLEGQVPTVKEQFGLNSLKVEFDGKVPAIGSIPGVAGIRGNGGGVEVRLRPGVRVQDVLKNLMEAADIRRFEVVAPTLHNIFIRQVGGNGTNA